MKDNLYALDEAKQSKNLAIVSLILSVLNILGFIWVFKLVNS